MSAATYCIGFAPGEAESPNKTSNALPALAALRAIPQQTPDERLAQLSERAQLGVWLSDVGSSPKAAALAQNIYEKALDGARCLGHRFVVRTTVEGWRLIPILLPSWESDDEMERRSR